MSMNNVTDRIVMAIFKGLMVVIVCALLLVLVDDYLLTHGNTVLNPLGANFIVKFLDSTVGNIFWGPHADINRLLCAIIVVPLVIIGGGLVFKYKH